MEIMELDDFDKDFIKLLVKRTPYSYEETEPIYKRLNRDMSTTKRIIEIASMFNITLERALNVRSYYVEEDGKSIITFFDGTEEIIKR